METEIINYQNATRLPLKVLAKAENSSSVIEIQTPMGIRIIELSEVRRGMFSSPTETSRSTDYILNKISQAEEDSLDYLLEKWLIELRKSK